MSVRHSVHLANLTHVSISFLGFSVHQIQHGGGKGCHLKV